MNDSHYDTIVIGAGISGLICGNYLSRAGKRVLLLEQNHQPGGNMAGFHRRGYYFDAGDQSFESLGIVFPILRELGLYDPADFTRLRYRMVSDHFDFYIDSLDGVETALRAAFPEEHGISEIFEEVRQVSRFLNENYAPDSFPLLNDFRLRHIPRAAKWLPRLRRWLTFDYREKIARRIQDPGLRTWFTHIGYKRMPFLFFAGFWHIWMQDYWYPEGGMQRFLDRLAGSFREHGGEIRFNTMVDHIEVDESSARARSVVTATGERLSAQQFVYAADYKRFVGEILDERYFKKRFVEKIREAELTEEILSVYLGLDMPPQELASHLGAQHVFLFPNYDVIFPDEGSPRDVHSRMWVALNAFGGENPDGAPAGHSSLVLQTYSSYHWEDYWHNGSDADSRRDEYRRFKTEVAGELVRTAERLVPKLASRIEYLDAGTPLSLKRFTRNTEGSTGGWCYDDKVSPVFRSPGLNMIKTPLSNLYASGHYALWPGGVISAALSGRMVANKVLGRRMLSRMPQPLKYQ
ncbi:MAG: phytoene desaturase family protein [Spirochaetaceae bacterium]